MEDWNKHAVKAGIVWMKKRKFGRHFDGSWKKRKNYQFKARNDQLIPYFRRITCWWEIARSIEERSWIKTLVWKVRKSVLQRNIPWQSWRWRRTWLLVMSDALPIASCLSSENALYTLRTWGYRRRYGFVYGYYTSVHVFSSVWQSLIILYYILDQLDYKIHGKAGIFPILNYNLQHLLDEKWKKPHLAQCSALIHNEFWSI